MMNFTTRIKWLKISLIIIGLVFIFGIYFFLIYWPAGFRWKPYQYEYEQMILGIYITLGVFLLFAAKNPLLHLSLIWFTAWSSLVHGFIMLIQSFVDKGEYWHLAGDVPALLIIAIVLAWLIPSKKQIEAHTSST